MAKPVVGVISRVTCMHEALCKKMPNIKFIDIMKNTKQMVESNKLKVVVADGNLLANVIYDLPDVEWVQGSWAGYDLFFAKYNPSKKISYIITRNTGPHMGFMMAEYIVTNLIVWERDLTLAYKQQEQQIWDRSGKILDYRTISDLRISILGTGVISQYVASTLKTFGVKQLWGYNKCFQENIPHFDKVSTDIKEVLSNSDVIVNLLPGTKNTYHFLDLDKFSACKNAIFINVGRSNVTTDKDVVEAINQKYLSAAIIDVFLEEPLPKDNILWKNKQVLLTPHLAALPRAIDVARLFAENWVRWEKKEKLLYILDLEKQY